ncbi:hypothetical protein [Mucilaginibacter pocheonensis]|uniref:Uncharacterized protein n=1 Tax=Mucilaginibacter pocheonensis TaxID=398050 RepID=A0ABU1T6C4_9SPHI|nr:hypothetical protein [Mucilaginibacter pocheonensis]MDR6940932.1 hypothetical protein [Mucilaginibacter pocheonensis]
MLTKSTRLVKEANAWIKRTYGPDEIIRVVPAPEDHGEVPAYYLYTAFAKDPDFLGRILFDAQGYWIYDGEIFTIPEQEQLAHFIITYIERV